MEDYIKEAKKIFDIEIEALICVRDSIGDTFLEIIQNITINNFIITSIISSIAIKAIFSLEKRRPEYGAVSILNAEFIIIN